MLCVVRCEMCVSWHALTTMRTPTQHNLFYRCDVFMEFSSAPVNINAFSTIACLFLLSALVQFGKVVVVWVLLFCCGCVIGDLCDRPSTFVDSCAVPVVG